MKNNTMKNNTMKNKTMINSLKNLGFDDLGYNEEESSHSLDYISPSHDTVIRVDLYDDPNSEGRLKITKNIKGGTNTIELQSPLLTIPFIKSKVIEYTGLDIDKISSKFYTWEACIKRLDKKIPQKTSSSDQQLLAQVKLMTICDALNRDFPKLSSVAVYSPVLGLGLTWCTLNVKSINPLVYLKSLKVVKAFCKHEENIELLKEYFSFTGELLYP